MSGLLPLRVQRPPPLGTGRGREAPVEAGATAAALIAAVAGILRIAAERAARAGEFALLREAVDGALDAVVLPPADPRDDLADDLPRIADADPCEEAARLGALMARGRPG